MVRDDGSGTEARAWTPWLWTVAMLFGLPAPALTIAILFAHAPKRDCKPAPRAGGAGLFLCRSVE